MGWEGEHLHLRCGTTSLFLWAWVSVRAGSLLDQVAVGKDTLDMDTVFRVQETRHRCCFQEEGRVLHLLHPSHLLRQ
jgi:hypothetical protein